MFMQDEQLMAANPQLTKLFSTPGVIIALNSALAQLENLRLLAQVGEGPVEFLGFLQTLLTPFMQMHQQQGAAGPSILPGGASVSAGAALQPGFAVGAAGAEAIPSTSAAAAAAPGLACLSAVVVAGDQLGLGMQPIYVSNSPQLPLPNQHCSNTGAAALGGMPCAGAGTAGGPYSMAPQHSTKSHGPSYQGVCVSSAEETSAEILQTLLVDADGNHAGPSSHRKALSWEPPPVQQQIGSVHVLEGQAPPVPTAAYSAAAAQTARENRLVPFFQGRQASGRLASMQGIPSHAPFESRRAVAAAASSHQSSTSESGAGAGKGVHGSVLACHPPTKAVLIKIQQIHPTAAARITDGLAAVPGVGAAAGVAPVGIDTAAAPEPAAWDCTAAAIAAVDALFAKAAAAAVDSGGAERGARTAPDSAAMAQAGCAHAAETTEAAASPAWKDVYGGVAGATLEASRASLCLALSEGQATSFEVLGVEIEGDGLHKRETGRKWQVVEVGKLGAGSYGVVQLVWARQIQQQTEKATIAGSVGWGVRLEGPEGGLGTMEAAVAGSAAAAGTTVAEVGPQKPTEAAAEFDEWQLMALKYPQPLAKVDPEGGKYHGYDWFYLGAMANIYGNEAAVLVKASPNGINSHTIFLYEHGRTQLPGFQQAAPCLLMEYAELGSLEAVRERLCNGGMMSPEMARLFMVKAVKAVAAFHQHSGSIHRDIKPANLLVQGTLSGGLEELHVKVGDCGSSLLLRGAWDLGGTWWGVGTEAYNPPEAGKRGGRHCMRWDTWSLGCLLLYLRFGGRPFEYLFWLRLQKKISEEEFDRRRTNAVAELDNNITADGKLAVLTAEEKKFLSVCLQPNVAYRPMAAYLARWNDYITEG